MSSLFFSCSKKEREREREKVITVLIYEHHFENVHFARDLTLV